MKRIHRRQKGANKISINIYFCEAPTAIFPIVQLISKQQPTQKYIVVTTKKSVSIFFNKYYAASTILCVEPIPCILSKNPFRLIMGILRTIYYKKYLWQLFNKYKGCNIFFFSVAYAISEYWLVQKMSRLNNVVFYSVNSLKGFKDDRSFHSFFLIILYRILYNLPIRCLKNGDFIMPFLSKEFFIKNNIPIIKWETIGLNDKILEKFNLPHTIRDILFITDDLVRHNIVNEKEYVNKMDPLIMCLLDKYGQDKIGIKPHPDNPKLYGRENSISFKISQYLISEITLDCFNVVIGYGSFALAQAADAGKLTISMLDYIEPVDYETKQRFKRYLATNCKKMIYYPKTLEEIKDLIEAKLKKGRMANVE